MDEEIPLTHRLEGLDLLMHLLCDIEVSNDEDVDRMLHTLLVSAWPTRRSQDQ